MAWANACIFNYMPGLAPLLEHFRGCSLPLQTCFIIVHPKKSMSFYILTGLCLYRLPSLYKNFGILEFFRFATPLYGRHGVLLSIFNLTMFLIAFIGILHSIFFRIFGNRFFFAKIVRGTEK